MPIELLGKSKTELTDLAVSLGEPSYRGAQLYQPLYVEPLFDLSKMSTLPAALRERLANEAKITLPTIRQRYNSTDGSVRYLFSLPPGDDRATSRPASVEAVFMPSDGRQTICISTQAGCAVDCQFCLTAQLGLIRNLTAGEIVAQVLMPLAEMKARESAGPTAGQPKRPASLPSPGRAEGGPYSRENPSGGLAARTNVVLMGQGEPMLNFDSVMGALRILLDAEG